MGGGRRPPRRWTRRAGAGEAAEQRAVATGPVPVLQAAADHALLREPCPPGHRQRRGVAHVDEEVHARRPVGQPPVGQRPGGLGCVAAPPGPWRDRVADLGAEPAGAQVDARGSREPLTVLDDHRQARAVAPLAHGDVLDEPARVLAGVGDRQRREPALAVGVLAGPVDGVGVVGPERPQEQPLGAHRLGEDVDAAEVEGGQLLAAHGGQCHPWPRTRSTEISRTTRAGFSRGCR